MLTKKSSLAWILASLMMLTSMRGDAWIKEEGRFLHHPEPLVYYDLSTELPQWLFNIGYSTGKRVGINEDYASMGLLWYPDFYFGNYRTLVDVSAYRLNTGKWAASAGVGIRRWNPTFDSVLGGNFFYDFRAGDLGNYNQVGLGFEWLTCSFDVRINGYLPIGHTCRCKLCQITFFPDGGFWSMCNQSRCAFSGIDAEVGGPFFSCGPWSVYGALGTYFWRRPHFGNAYGVQARLEVRWNDWIELEVYNSYDSLFHNRTQGTFTLNIPFESLCCLCFSECNVVCPWWNRPIQRQPMIVLDKSCCWKTNYEHLLPDFSDSSSSDFSNSSSNISD